MSKKVPTSLLKKLNSLYNVVSHPYSFIFIIVIIIGWFFIGIFRNYDDVWYKSFHIFESVIALLMIFIIERTQRADNQALQEKLDEIIKAIPQASNKKAGIEKLFKGEKK